MTIPNQTIFTLINWCWRFARVFGVDYREIYLCVAEQREN